MLPLFKKDKALLRLPLILVYNDLFLKVTLEREQVAQKRLELTSFHTQFRQLKGLMAVKLHKGKLEKQWF